MNDAVRWWPGLLQKMLHHVPADARQVRIGGVDGRVALCGCVTVPAFGSKLDEWSRCETCVRDLAGPGR
ncbi:hypothetical protein ABZ805_03485 [Saccharopolyspora sp. NPDC047091]|uniref:hypothetical protein n=1 Tax=Saccharopolyspora sp. NPDC047091 TaxID=3155924 RepID=UPI0033CC79BA